MPENGRFKVTMLCGGKEMAEYHAKTEGIATTCWVASEIGKSFSLSLEDLKKRGRGDPWARAKLFVDGHLLTRKCIHYGKPLVIDGYKQRVSERTVHKYPLVFSLLELTDDETVAPIMDAEQLGCIKVEVCLSVDDFVTQKRRFTIPQELGFSNIAHEQSKKLTVHKATLGENPIVLDKLMNNEMVRITRPYDERNPGPVAVFKFLYRPKDILEAEGIIVDVKSKGEVGRAAGLLKLEREREKLDRAIKTLKREATLDDLEEFIVKRKKVEGLLEPSLSINAEEVIDLTNED